MSSVFAVSSASAAPASRRTRKQSSDQVSQPRVGHGGYVGAGGTQSEGDSIRAGGDSEHDDA